GLVKESRQSDLSETKRGSLVVPHRFCRRCSRRLRTIHCKSHNCLLALVITPSTCRTSRGRTLFLSGGMGLHVALSFLGEKILDICFVYSGAGLIDDLV